MTFIRAKEIPPGSGNWYRYEVMGIRKGNKVRQKVIRYLGRVDSGYSPSSDNHVPISLSPTFEEPVTPIKNPATIHKLGELDGE